MEHQQVRDAHKAVVSYMLANGLGLADAEDLAQDAIVRALDGFDPSKASLSTYAITIAKRRRIDLARRRRTRLDNIGHVADTYDTVDKRTPESLTIGNGGVVRIAEIVQSLPESERLALTLATIDGWSHSEIAELLDCAVGTVAYLVNQARTKIRKKYQG